MIRPLDADDLRRRVETAVPFPHFVIDDFFDADFALRVGESFPSFEDALRIGRSFRTVNERKKVQVTNTAQFPPVVLELNGLLASPSWLGLLSEVFGMPGLLADEQLTGGGMHQTGSRGRLDVHVDFNYIAARQLHRRLNVLVFFNPGWKPAWGGSPTLGSRCEALRAVARTAIQSLRGFRNQRYQLPWRDGGGMSSRPRAEVVRGLLLHQRIATSLDRKRA